MAAQTPIPKSDLEAIRQRVKADTPFWAESFGKIVDKMSGRLIPFVFNPAQLELDRLLEEQRAAGKPMRAVVLKARQVGMSTGTQGKLVHRATLNERYDTVTVAHDRETGGKLYRMAETLYRNLPEDAELKPKLGKYRRQKEMHFAGDVQWQHENSFPDSRYLVDTAGEFQAGRGGTYRGIHASEVAFWDQIGIKLTALKAAVPREPDTMIVLESTANGFNEFKDIWDDAAEGRSGYIAFFWPWWQQAEYKMPFASDSERERFTVGDPNHPYAEEEPDLVKHHALTLEQLNWRRQTIADEGNGDVRNFHQEYPSTPEEAFIATGQKVFDPYRVAQLQVKVELTDPRAPTVQNPGPLMGDFTVASTETVPSRNGGTIEVPKSALWTLRTPGIANPNPPWRSWVSMGEGVGAPRPPGEYVIAVDVSGGLTESTLEPDYHAIEVIDHKTGEQVAEYRSRIDVDLLAEQVMLAALYFNSAYVVVERTGSWGQPVLRILYFDYHYPFLYRSKRVGNANEKTEQRLGWDTNVRTKPILVAGMAELLRIEEDGIKSRTLAGEVRTYTRNEKGGTEAEPGRYDDCLMAYMIGKHAARELPLKAAALGAASSAGGFSVSGGVSAYDARYG